MADKLRDHVVRLEAKLADLTIRMAAVELLAKEAAKHMVEYLEGEKENDRKITDKVNEIVGDVNRIDGNVEKVNEALATAFRRLTC